jgi:uncharacterized membrane protein/mono/diheme cytochrome c family protein
MADISDTAQFVGRLHLLLLHLPIGFLLLLAALELVACLPGLRNANASAGFILALAVPASLLTAFCGWQLARTGGYDEQLLFWHRWLGVAAAGLVLITAAGYRFRATIAYRLTLLATVVVLTIASHYGGSITHGKDFLTRHAPAPLKRLFGGGAAAETGGATAPSAYAAVVQPILDRTCVACHSAEKPKGKLRLDSFVALLAGGAGGAVVQPGRSAESELIKRLLLPLDHDDHMPPEGKPQPTPEEIALLRWWIDAGADGVKTVAELNPNPDIARLIEARSR